MAAMTTSETTREARAIQSRVPLTAAVLGAAGALPFLGLLMAQRWGVEPFGRPPLSVLALYAAVILAFMGAVHWGLAMAEYGGRRDTTWSYIMSVIPALLGWFALAFLPMTVALGVIALGFALLLAYDLRALRLGRAPAWYGSLRWPLTLVAVSCLLAAMAMG